MTIKLKSLNEQVIVITGASSGIGLATAITASENGAKVVLAARSGQTLEKIVAGLIQDGHDALCVTCDVSQQDQVEQLAQTTVSRFGRIDTWVNNAGTGIYGRLDEVSDQDSRQVFETNFWGVVYGSLAALPHLRKQGGALINVGSEVSEASVPLLGMYVASKHAVKGFTDCLRIEIEDVDQAPISITLIQPTAVNTPFPEHACNYQPQEAKLPEPQIAPQDVADAILHAATTPTRNRKVGLRASLNVAMAKWMPAMGDYLAAGTYHKQHTEQAETRPAGALYASSESTGTAGSTTGR